MSDLPSLEQQFSFEVSAVRLDDGTFFQPLKDARRRYPRETPAAYRISGSHWEALYECKDGRLILLQFSTPMVRRGLWQPKIREAYDVVGFEVDPHYAMQFLIDSQKEIPDEFQELLNVKADEPVVGKSIRPINDWKGKFPVENSRTPVHETRVIDILPEIRDRGIATVHQLQEWVQLPTGSRNTSGLIQLVFRLTRRYRVDPANWNGPANGIPPKSISLGELPWPDGIDNIKNHVLPELVDVLEAPAALILSTQMFHIEPRADDVELEFAEQFIIDRLDQIAGLIGEIKQAVHDLESGKVHKSLQRAEFEELKPPSPEAIVAYLLSPMMEAAEIIERLKLTIHPGTLGRWIKKARKWCERNGIPPQLVALAESAKQHRPTIKSMSPDKIDLGKRQGKPIACDDEDDE